VRLHGKGGKDRLCPLWRETARALGRVLACLSGNGEGLVFRNARDQPLSRDGVAYLLDKYVHFSIPDAPPLARCRVTSHVLRHSCAVALLQAGLDVTVIRDYLGHASVATTSRYIASNLTMKREALETFWRRAGLASPSAAAWRPKPDLLAFLDSL
jgi:integrase/recombinase XerD